MSIHKNHSKKHGTKSVQETFKVFKISMKYFAVV